jgi:hypothetical protein
MPEASQAVTGPDEESLEGCIQSPSSNSSLASASELSPELTGRTRSTPKQAHVWLSSRGRGNGSHHKMIIERFQAGTTELSPSPSSSSSSSSSEPPIAGAIDTRSGQQMMSVTCPDIRKRPHISDLQQHASTSRITNEKHPAQKPNPILTPPPKRRCASANAATRIRSKFASPDRYVPQRPSIDQGCPPYHTNKSPSSLRGRELYTRHRDHTRNPFRTVSDRSNEVARRRDGHNRYGLRFPHYTPSFVHGDDASPFAIDPTNVSQTGRQLSWGGFWSVGGRNAAQLGHLHAVPTGAAGMTASGTNAPMHTPCFLDTPTRDDQVEAHEGRLALAMGIDQATRILQCTPPSLRTAHTPIPDPEGLKWRDNIWTRDRMPKSERPRHPILVQLELR